MRLLTGETMTQADAHSRAACDEAQRAARASASPFQTIDRHGQITRNRRNWSGRLLPRMQFIG